MCKDLKIQQIVINEQLQELVIMYNNQSNNISQLAQIIEKHLSLPIKIKYNTPAEMVINDMYATREELQVIFEEIRGMLASNDLNDFYHNITLAAVMTTTDNVKYAKYDMRVANERFIDFYCMKNKQIVNNIVNNTVNNIGNQTIIINYGKSKKAPSSTTAEENWTKNNPPHDKESIANYYARYKMDNPNGVANTVFGKVMAKSEDYQQVHSGKSYYWIKQK